MELSVEDQDVERLGVLKCRSAETREGLKTDLEGS
jgi:hypothetical protein